MSAVRHDHMSFAAYLKSRGIVWDDIEKECDSKTTMHQRDSYSNAVANSVQCTGFIESKNVGGRRSIDSTLSDRCMTKTRHPSARCPKHRKQVR